MAYQSLEELLDSAPKNQNILNNLAKAYNIINRDEYQKIICSTSGGSDSDVMMDIIQNCDVDHKVKYIWYKTGLEWQATKDHFKELEQKYNITIHPIMAKHTIPWTCMNVGRPFVSKRVSDYISRLQAHDFKWEDKSFEELKKEYPTCLVALKWWCNAWGEDSQFNIKRNTWLKEFMIENPPTFKITHKCCVYAKEMTGDQLTKEEECDLQMIGVRKAEGGVRSTAYKNCFSQYDNKTDQYRPIYFYTDADKQQYKEHYKIKNSDCYTKYGLHRTGWQL